MASLLVNEPPTILDVERKEARLGLLLEASRDSSATLLYVTHDPAQARQVGGRVLTIEKGRLVS